MKHVISQVDIPQSGRTALALAKRIGKVAEELGTPAVDVARQLFELLADDLYDAVKFGSSSNTPSRAGLRVALDVVNGAMVLTIGSSEAIDKIHDTLLKGISLHDWLVDNAKNYTFAGKPADANFSKLPV
jgi:hypothetical protein